jgi:hypothetical protein
MRIHNTGVICWILNYLEDKIRIRLVNIVIFDRLTKSSSRSIIRIGMVLGPAPGLPPPPYTIAPLYFCTPTSRPHPHPPPHFIVPPKWQKDPVPNRTPKNVLLIPVGYSSIKWRSLRRTTGDFSCRPPGVPCPDPPGASPSSSSSSSSA